MEFHEVRFPANLSFGSVGGPELRTEIVTLQNGFEERNSPWAHSRRRYDAGVGLRSLEDVEALIAFFEARRGQLFGFRWKDWADHKSSPARKATGPLDQFIGTGDGVQSVFALQKVYQSGEYSYLRPIRKPVAGTVSVAVGDDPRIEGDELTVNPTTGQILFAVPPPQGARVTAGFEFDVPVRFDTDRVQVSVASFQAGDLPNVSVVEIRL